MPFANPKDLRNASKAILVVSGILLVFGQIPVLNISISTPLVAGLSFGTLLGLFDFLVAYWLQKKI